MVAAVVVAVLVVVVVVIVVLLVLPESLSIRRHHTHLPGSVHLRVTWIEWQDAFFYSQFIAIVSLASSINFFVKSIQASLVHCLRFSLAALPIRCSNLVVFCLTPGLDLDREVDPNVVHRRSHVLRNHRPATNHPSTNSFLSLLLFVWDWIR